MMMFMMMMIMIIDDLVMMDDEHHYHHDEKVRGETAQRVSALGLTLQPRHRTSYAAASHFWRTAGTAEG